MDQLQQGGPSVNSQRSLLGDGTSVSLQDSLIAQADATNYAKRIAKRTSVGGLLQVSRLVRCKTMCTPVNTVVCFDNFTGVACNRTRKPPRCRR